VLAVFETTLNGSAYLKVGDFLALTLLGEMEFLHGVAEG
jgi:hypothetical protein